jgi:hypothetical protein
VPQKKGHAVFPEVLRLQRNQHPEKRNAPLATPGF